MTNMGDGRMKIGEATAIFNNIESELYSVEEKGTAILQVVNMKTHNGVTKSAMLHVIRFLLPMVYDVPDDLEVKQ